MINRIMIAILAMLSFAGAGWYFRGVVSENAALRLENARVERWNKDYLILQGRVNEADKLLQRAKKAINRSADAVISAHANKLRFKPCKQNATISTINSGNESRRKVGRAAAGTVDFGEVAKEIIELGRDRDQCAIKYNELIGVCSQ